MKVGRWWAWLVVVTAVVTVGVVRTAAASAPGMVISGAHLYRDGGAFTVHGFSMQAAEAPDWCTSYPWGAVARAHYGAAELDAYTTGWHANTLRFQVSQPGLTSHTPNAYLQEVKLEVALARSKGLTVILSMQDQRTACGTTQPEPTAATARAWHELERPFAGDPYVMFELYNEPEVGGSKAQWHRWAGDMQHLIGDLRGWGANNAILVDGGDWARWLTGVRLFPLHDVGGGRGVGYAVHPYSFDQPDSRGVTGPAQWQRAYGFATRRHVVVVTEWSYAPRKCSTNAPKLTPTFLSFLRRHSIGMTAFAGDVMHHTMADWKYDPTYCGGPIGGSGKQTQDWFKTL